MGHRRAQRGLLAARAGADHPRRLILAWAWLLVHAFAEAHAYTCVDDPVDPPVAGAPSTDGVFDSRPEVIAPAVPAALAWLRSVGDAADAGRLPEPAIGERFVALATAVAMLRDGPWRDEVRAFDPIGRLRRLLRQVGGVAAEAGAVDGLARQFLAAGRIDEARRMLVEAADAEASWLRATACVLLADIHRHAADWPAAEDCLRRADDALAQPAIDADAPDVRELRCVQHGVLGQLQLELGLVDAAFIALDEAQRLAAGLPERPYLGWETQVRRSDLLLLTERFERLIAETHPWLENPGIDAGLAGALDLAIALATAELELRDPAAPRTAETILRRALQRPIDPAAQLAGDFMLAELAMRDRRFAEAETHLAAARTRLTLADDGSVRATPRLPQLAFLEALCGRLARLRGDDRPRLATRLAALRDALGGLLASFERMPLRPGGVGLLRVRSWRTLLGELTLLCLAADDRGAEAALEAIMATQVCGTLARRQRLTAPTWDELRPLLRESRGGALIFLPTGTGSHLLLADQAGVQAFPLPAEHHLRLAVQSIEERLRTPPMGDDATSWQPAADAATAALLPQAARARIAGWRHLYVVGDDLLGGIPLAALRPDGRHALGLTTPISYAPSLPLLLELRRQAGTDAQPRDLDLLLLAAPAHDPAVAARWPKLAPLSLSPVDRATLRGPFAPDRVRVAGGGEASLGLLREQAHHAWITALLCHGAYAAERERPAGLILAPAAAAHDGLVWCEQIEEIRPSPLVVLGACGAARGPQRSGDDGGAHLGGAFLLAGARVVVQATADLDLAASVALIGGLLDRVGRGDAPAAALCRASQAVAAKEDWRHPFFHSQLRVVGLGHLQVLPPGRTTADRSPGVCALRDRSALLLFVAGVLGVWLWQRRLRIARRR